MVASPTSIYLWVMFFASLWKTALFPGSEAGMKHKEAALHKCLCFLTLLYEIGMTVVAVAYGKFSQAACFREYSKVAVLRLLWPLLLLLQYTVCIYLFNWTILGKRSCMEHHRNGDCPAADLTTWFHTWTPRILQLSEGSESHLSCVVLAVLQVQILVLWVPLPGFITGCGFVIYFCALLLKLKHQRSFDTELGYVHLMLSIIMIDSNCHLSVYYSQ